MGFFVEGFFFNPNIQPKSEYLKRKSIVDKVKKIFDIEVLEGPYCWEKWHKICDPFKDEREGGKRCLLCYEFRLRETFKILSKNASTFNDFCYFTTTLTISPHKRSKEIFEIGEKIGGEKFLKIDFKKKDGFKKSCEIASTHNFYRQNYCGCIYSIHKSQIAK